AFLEAPTEVFGEELFRAGDHGHVVHRPREPVTLVRCDQVFDGEATVAQRNDYLVGLSLVDARIVGALRYEKRRLALRCRVERRLPLTLSSPFRRARAGHA